MKIKLLLTSMVIGITLILTNCNTVEGVGKDIEKGGKVIEHAASSNK